jgi:hypothetical protein
VSENCVYHNAGNSIFRALSFYPDIKGEKMEVKMNTLDSTSKLEGKTTYQELKITTKNQ